MRSGCKIVHPSANPPERFQGRQRRRNPGNAHEDTQCFDPRSEGPITAQADHARLESTPIQFCKKSVKHHLCAASLQRCDDMELPSGAAALGCRLPLGVPGCQADCSSDHWSKSRSSISAHRDSGRRGSGGRARALLFRSCSSTAGWRCGAGREGSLLAVLSNTAMTLKRRD